MKACDASEAEIEKKFLKKFKMKTCIRDADKNLLLMDNKLSTAAQMIILPFEKKTVALKRSAKGVFNVIKINGHRY